MREGAKLPLRWLTKRHSQGHIASLVVLVICVIAAGALFFNRQFVVDQLSVWQYQPSEEVAQLAQRSAMNSQGKFYFYGSQPAVESAEKFNNECTKREEGTAILGCYNGRNIFIYNVTDARLDGIKEVTAAHEMLHAAYDRLSTEERAKIDTLLEAEYESIKNNKEFTERMAFYARTEPGERANELHSIIGTEVPGVSPALEEYYKKYFVDRTKVVALHEKYASIFLSLQKRSNELSLQLTEVGNAIEAQSTSYNAATAQLNADIAAFNARANSSGFTSQVQFQAERNALVGRARQLDANRSTINQLIAQYNQLRQELEVVASQSEALNRSINSSLEPAPSL